MTPDTTRKTCTECRQPKPLSEFDVDRRNKVVRSKCKQCRADLHRQYVDNNREALREKSREYFRLNRNARYAYRKTIDPIKARSRATLTRAVARGKIKKPEHCPICNKKSVLHGHHKDYSKPLEVEWLCSVCHGDKHRKH